MKKLTIVLLITSAVTLTYSCSKEEIIIIQEVESANSTSTQQVCGNAITYPDSAFYGVNILGVPDSSVLNMNSNFSMAATLDCNANLKIIMYNFSTGAGRWASLSGTLSGWLSSNYSITTRTELFQSNNYNSIILHMLLGFGGSGPGEARIDFYENNSATVTKSKYIFWN